VKKILAICSVVALGAFALFTAACCVLPLTEWTHPSIGRILQQPCDFNMRYNEARCVKEGTDPFDVWKHGVAHKPFVPMGQPVEGEFNAPVNGYTPWGYTLAMPLSLLPPRVAWCVYVIFMFACLGVLVWGGYGIGRRIGGDGRTAVVFATVPLLVVAYPIWSNFCIGNYAVPILAALYMMCWCLDRGHDACAGVFWAFAMIKPQNALLLAVPLLMRGKFKACFVAVAVCLALAVPPALLCHKSVITMILQIPSVGSGAFSGCATLPSYVRELMDTAPALASAAGIGLVLCVWLTARMRNADGWLLYATPAVMCSISWTYTTSYSFALAWFLCVAILVRLRVDRSVRTCALVLGALVLLPRFFTCFSGAAKAFSLCSVPPKLYSAIDTSVSLAVLLLTVLFCQLTTRKSTPLRINGNRI